MNRLFRRTLLVLLSFGCLWTPTWASESCAPVDIDASIADASRDYEIARIKLTRYDQVDYPLQLRRLDTQIRLAEAERDVWRRRVQEYSTLENWTGPTGLLITLDDARLSQLRLERLVDDLREERMLLERNHFDQRRLLKLESDAAASRLAKLRGIRYELLTSTKKELLTPAN
jgi:hypothetical protein